MKRKFNDTGLCVPQLHYMADTSEKIAKIVRMVEAGEYFTINRPRQFGKTTILSLLAQRLNKRDDYVALRITFEEMDPEGCGKQKQFISEILMMILSGLDFLGLTEAASFVEEQIGHVATIPELSRFITKFIRDALAGKSVVLLIDEVDKTSDIRFFPTFLGMLRNKYLQRLEGHGHTFLSVALAGVHDIKTLKAAIRPEEERKYGSPWNIAVDFKVDLSFSPLEIEDMLADYSREQGIRPDIPAIAGKLHYYTSGYPYLVSKLCKFIDEDIVPQREDKNWFTADVETAFKMIADEGYTTTLFDSLGKNLENNPELYDLIFRIVINGESFTFSIIDPTIHLAHIYGIIVPSEQGLCRIHNRIFEQRIYGYMISKFLRKERDRIEEFWGTEFLLPDGLNLEVILQRFQEFMKEHHSNRDDKFLEREGRLLFLSYLRPIINGKGFDFKEPNVADERRMDIVITYGRKRYVVELKVWRGAEYHHRGLQQLSDYLDIYSLKAGYLLIFDFSRGKKYKQEWIELKGKRIFAVWV